MCKLINNAVFAATGVPNISSPIEYNFTSSTLTCISTGGPATTVTWSRDNVPISESQSTTQQQLTAISTATYHNLLTITSSNIRDYSGSFSCNVSNIKGGDTESVTLNRKLLMLINGYIKFTRYMFY